MSFVGFGRKTFGRKGMAPAPGSTDRPERIFGSRPSPAFGRSAAESPFDQFYARAEDIASSQANTRPSGYLGVMQRARNANRNTVIARPSAFSNQALQGMTPEEKGELLADLPDQPGVFDGYAKGGDEREMLANAVQDGLWNHEVEIRKEHLGPLLRLLLENPRFRENSWALYKFDALFKWVEIAIAEGAYLSSGDCENLAELAQAMRSKRSRFRKADQKKMIARAEKLEKLAGVEVSAAEFLLARCEGADNEFVIADGPRANAQFWADLLAEVTASLNDIRTACKGSAKPDWGRSAAAFAAHWPACGEVQPDYTAWKGGEQPTGKLKEHNGKRHGWAEAESYRSLPQAILGAAAHSRFDWSSENIPGLGVLADLENPGWTALAEHLITQRRATKATKKWQNEALALCEPLGMETVEARLHDWLALFHSPALGRKNYTHVLNGERFAASVDRLNERHPDWPQAHAHELSALGRAIAICVASTPTHGLSHDFHPELVRLDDHTYKNRSATTGVLHLPSPTYKSGDGSWAHKKLAGWMNVSVENEEFIRGALWLVALMPDRARAIEALELTAQSAATYLRTGDDGMRSKIIANAAIATLIAMDDASIQASVLRLSKVVEHRSVLAPLLDYLNA